MAEPSLQLGNGNWAGKSGNLLAYHKANNNFYADELTFTRASTGTIVNADGLIEEVPYNLVTYSEQFDNAGWSKSSSTVTSNAATSPNGDLTADKLNIGSNGSLYQSGVSVVPNTEYTFSFYIQDIDSANNKLAIYDESNASFIAIDVAYSVTSEWTRVTYSFTTPTGCASARPYIQRASTLGSGSVYIWGAQVNSGSTAKTYYPTTTRLNIPRVDYLNNANGSLLLEPQRTNTVLSNSDYTASWSLVNVIPTANATTSPNGSNDAQKLTSANTFGQHYIRQVRGGHTVGAPHVFSCFAKAGELDILTLRLLNGGGPNVNFDLTNGTHDGGANGKMIGFGDGWYRCITYHASSTNQYLYPYIYTKVGNTQGDGVSGFYVYGAMIEEGSYETSLINTSGTTVTRLGENSSSSVLPNIVDDFTFFVDFVRYGQYANSGVYNFAVKNSTDTDRISIYKSSSVSNLNVAYKIGGVTTVTNIGASVGDFVHHKIAFVCNGTTVKVFKDGSLVDTKTGFLNSDLLTDIHLRTESISTTNEYGSKFRSTQFYLSALTDTELATLTTL